MAWYPIRLALELEARMWSPWSGTSRRGERALTKTFENQPIAFALQAQQRGTGDAVAREARAPGFHGAVMILYGDVPLLQASTLRRLVDAFRSRRGRSR